MKNDGLYFDKKYKCVSFIVHYKGLTLNTYLQYIVRRHNLIKHKKNGTMQIK